MVTAIAVVLLFMGSAVLTAGIALITDRTATGPAPPSDVAAPLQTATGPIHLPWPPIASAPPQGGLCTVPFFRSILVLFGNSCGWVSPAEAYAVNTANKDAAAENIVTTLSNYLNVTAAATDNLNATFQELLSYYESRAEAIVPEFLDYTWNDTLAAVIATDSGLVPSLEGFAQVLAQQEYQAWNATAASWAAAFGNGGAFASDTTYFVVHPMPSGTNRFWSYNGEDFNVTQPFEWWANPSYFGATGPDANTTYFNLEPGGTIVYADYLNQTPTSPATYTVYDLTRGTHFSVPYVTFPEWQNNSIPIVTQTHTIGQFDLLALVCSANCTAPNVVAGTSSLVETSGAFAFNQNVTKAPHGYGVPSSAGGYPGSAYINTGVPSLQILAPYTVVANAYVANGIIPATDWGACIQFGAGPGCYTATAPLVGNVTPLGSGPGAVTPGANALVSFGQTANSLYNNSMLMAYDYWLTLRAVTDNGTYNIPSNCAIPTPSDAFPVATDYLNYALSANDVEAVYLAYLNAVAQEYGQVFTSNVNFCGVPDLGFSFNWTQSWHLVMNITASLYFANSTTPLYINGTNDSTAVYTNPATWPVKNVDPALIYPTQYQLDVPVGKVFPIPVNNPLAAVLVNYTGNVAYGNPAFAPPWGVPSYTSLYGNGNYSNVSGQVSNIPSGRYVGAADAIDISSCVLNNVSQSTCAIAVTYFNQFTIGHIHAIVTPTPVPAGGGGLGALGNSCGFSVLNQFYDGWAGYIGSAVATGFAYVGHALAGVPLIGGGLSFLVNGLGCIIAWVIVILLFAVFVYVAAKVGVAIYRGAKGQRRIRNENVS